jgi:hypothetical protein
MAPRACACQPRPIRSTTANFTPRLFPKSPPFSFSPWIIAQYIYLSLPCCSYQPVSSISNNQRRTDSPQTSPSSGHHQPCTAYPISPLLDDMTAPMPSTFHRFPDLPIELRLNIYRATLTSRIVESDLDYDCTYPINDLHRHSPPLPTALSFC